jgi:hypothetical protein
MQITVDADRLFRRHVMAIAALVGLYVALNLASVALQLPRMLGLLAVFDLNGEHNVPALFSCFALICAAAVGHTTGQLDTARGAPNVLPWHAMTMLLLFLAADEAFMVHEQVGRALRIGYGLRGGWHYSWVFAYLLPVLVLGTMAVPFVRRLPAKTRASFMIAGAVYLAGAAGMETVGGFLAGDLNADGEAAPRGLDYLLSVALEEALEMLGVALLIRGMLRHGALVQREVTRPQPVALDRAA